MAKRSSRPEDGKRAARRSSDAGKRVGANGKVLAARHKREAVDRAAARHHVVTEFMKSGLTFRAMIERLNQRNEPAPSGRGRWHIRTLQRLLALAPAVEARRQHRDGDTLLARSASAIETARQLRDAHARLQRRTSELMARSVALRQTLLAMHPLVLGPADTAARSRRVE